ncbi:Imm10 family immunity protein [Actinoplanes cyaneus]|nr:Imm10 family immunity protein [Actinoplanes cyaneus]
MQSRRVMVARAAGFEIDDADEVVEAGFAEEPDGSGFALMFQRTDYEPDEQDVRFGFDTYCLTTGDGRTHYGGLRSAKLAGADLTLTISPDASATIGVAEVSTITLDVDADSLAAFRDGLPQVVNWGRDSEIPALSGF